MQPNSRRRRFGWCLIRTALRPSGPGTEDCGHRLSAVWLSIGRQKPKVPPVAALRTEAQQLTRVKRKLERVTKERDFLGRAAAFLAEEYP